MSPYWGLGKTPPQTTLDPATVLDSLPGGRYSGLVGPNRHVWVGYIEPLPGRAFSDLGDSGSLVYAINNGVRVRHLQDIRTY
jgi:hypothetical protein